VAFLVILSLILVCDVVLCAWMVRSAPRRGLALVLLAVGGLPLAHLLWMLVARQSALRAHEYLPMAVIAYSYLWNLLVAPAATLAIVARVLWRHAPLRRQAPTDLSRRRFLAACAACVPPVAAGATVAATLPGLGAFRVRRIRAALPGLPEGLDGLTIAHVSDLHYGKFTDPADVERVVQTVNGLEADLVAFTGDLIDLSIRDLPAALDALGRVRARAGVFACEGNHDLIDDRDEFRRRAGESGIPFLLDDARTVEARDGRVQVHGVHWERDQEGRRRAAARARGRSEPGAFPILLAHHPHVFDEAEGFPLTLSGHTHGGLLMWNERLGAGPILYRYWSGLYEKGERAIVVSNGVGNWFPLRTHAPAEVIHLTIATA